jgi:hypothetical protein
MTRKKGNHRHAFRFRVGTKDDPKIITCWAKVKPAKTDVYLPLKAAHVQRSIGLRGVGNSQTCTMAVCASQEKENFPHPVEGYIDWFYHRAYVVSKLDKNGLPIECYAYAHSKSFSLNCWPRVIGLSTFDQSRKTSARATARRVAVGTAAVPAFNRAARSCGLPSRRWAASQHEHCGHGGADDGSRG